jgi:hypothetical protein
VPKRWGKTARLIVTLVIRSGGARISAQDTAPHISIFSETKLNQAEGISERTPRGRCTTMWVSQCPDEVPRVLTMEGLGDIFEGPMVQPANGPDIGKLLIVLGGILVIVGAALILSGKIPWLGRLPGDIYIQRRNFTFFFPLTTSILLSVVLSLLLYLFFRR